MLRGDWAEDKQLINNVRLMVGGGGDEIQDHPVSLTPSFEVCFTRNRDDFFDVSSVSAMA